MLVLWYHLVRKNNQFYSNLLLLIEWKHLLFYVLVECKVKFGSAIYNSNQPIELFVYLQANCVNPITFNRLFVRFNLSSYNQYCVIENANELSFEPYRIKTFKFSFIVDRLEIGKDLEVKNKKIWFYLEWKLINLI